MQGLLESQEFLEDNFSRLYLFSVRLDYSAEEEFAKAKEILSMSRVQGSHSGYSELR